MPISHYVDKELSVLVVTRSGHIDTHDEEEAFQAREADPELRPGMSVLVDCRKVEGADSTETVRYLANHVTALASRLRCGPVAIVVATDVEYGMARMYVALTEIEAADDRHETEILRTMEEARAWLRGLSARPQ